MPQEPGVPGKHEPCDLLHALARMLNVGKP